jgi:hypothetical protein
VKLLEEPGALVALSGGAVVVSGNAGVGSRGDKLIDGQLNRGRGQPMRRLQCRSRSVGGRGDCSRIVCTLLISLCCC